MGKIIIKGARHRSYPEKRDGKTYGEDDYWETDKPEEQKFISPSGFSEEAKKILRSR